MITGNNVIGTAPECTAGTEKVICSSTHENIFQKGENCLPVVFWVLTALLSYLIVWLLLSTILAGSS